MNRKTFLKTSSIASIGLLLGNRALIASSLNLKKIGEYSYIFKKSGGTILIHESNENLIIVDSQYPKNVEPFINHFKLGDVRKIDMLINTHHHGDHTGGNQILGKYAKMMVSHKRVPQLLIENAERRDQEVGLLPTTTFKDYLAIDRNTENIHLYHYGQAHTSGDAVVYFENDNVAHMGDLVFNYAHPYIDRSAGASIQNWIPFLEKTVEKLPKDAVYITGHSGSKSKVIGTVKDILAFRDYLSAILEITRKAIEEGISKEQFLKEPTLNGFEHIENLGQRLNLSFVLGVAYDELHE